MPYNRVLNTSIRSCVRRVPLAWAVRATALFLEGRTRYCSFSDIWRGYGKSVRQYARQTRYQAMCHLLEEDGDLELWNTPSGRFWVPGPNGSVHLAYVMSEIDLGTYGSVTPDDVVVDAGANVGIFTRYALTCGARTVIAFEPAPDTAECLRRNLRSEVASGQVIVEQRGLWRESGEMGFHVFDDCGHCSLMGAVNKDTRTILVKLTELDTWLLANGINHVDLLKIDVEGAEAGVMEGATRLLSTSAPRVVVEVAHTDNPINNIAAVLKTIHQINPSYQVQSDLWITLCHGVLCPGVLAFSGTPQCVTT